MIFLSADLNHNLSRPNPVKYYVKISSFRVKTSKNKIKKAICRMSIDIIIIKKIILVDIYSQIKL